jgi:hypothetical protein
VEGNTHIVCFKISNPEFLREPEKNYDLSETGLVDFGVEFRNRFLEQESGNAEPSTSTFISFGSYSRIQTAQQRTTNSF